MNLTPSSEKTSNNLGNACKSKQTSDHQHGPNTTPLRPNKSEPRANSSNLMVVKLSQNQNGVVTGPFTPPSMISSPRFKSTPATSWLRLKNITPNRSTLQRSCVTQNPFETGILDSLSKHMFSPNVFRVPTPDKKTPKFQWSIDDIAILRPTEIDETSAMDSFMPTEHNAEFEEVAQRAIDEYFSSQVIAPSPWSNSAKKGQSTKASNSGSSSKNRLLFQSPLTNKSTTTTPKKQAVDSGVGTQTMISIPPNFDFDAFTGGRFCLNESRLNELNSDPKANHGEDEEAEGLNNLSLRRKLFFHHQMGHPPILNLQDLSYDDDNDNEGEGGTPHSEKTGFEEDMDIIAGDGSYEMYASSPIHLRSESPRLVRSPFGGHHQFLASPEMSPISKFSSDSSQLPTPVRPLDFDHHTKVSNEEATSKRFPASTVRKIATVPNLLPKAFNIQKQLIQTSDETGIESLGIEDHGKSIGFHDTMMDFGSTLGDTQHADTGYASNNLGTSSQSNLTNQFYKLSQQDTSVLCDGFEVKNPHYGYATTKLDGDHSVMWDSIAHRGLNQRP